MASIPSETEPTAATDSAQARPASPLFSCVEIVLLAFVVAGCICTIRFAAYYLPVPYSLNFEEGIILNAAVRITHGQTPYPPVGGPPYVVDPYGPVFYYTLAPLVKWFGAGFLWPRVLALTAGLAASLFIVLLLRRWTGAWAISLAFGLLYLAMPLERTWSFILRVDFFALALALAGLYGFSKGWRPIWPALLFLAALYSKPSFIAAPLACWAAAMWGGERRRGWTFIGWMAAMGLAGLGALAYFTQGWGLFHIFRTYPDPYEFGHYSSTMLPVALVDFPLLFAGAALAVRDIRQRTLSLPLAYLLLATAVTLTAGKLGADTNQLLEWQAALCLAAGCGYYAMRSLPKPEPGLALIPVGLALVVLGTALHNPRTDPRVVGCADAYRFAAQHPGELLSQNPGAAVLSGKTVWLSNPFEYKYLCDAGLLSQQPLVRLVQQKFFGLILADGEISQLRERPFNAKNTAAIWPKPFVEALEQNYRPVARFSCAYANVAYEPVPAAQSR
jgi:hypothetical protein